MLKLLSLTAASLAALAASPALAQDAEPTGFDGIYVGGSFGYDVQSNDIGSSIRFDRNLDGGFNDTVLTGTGGNAFSTGFCNGRAITANAPGQTSAAAPTQPQGAGCVNDKDDIAYYGRVGIDSQMGRFVVGVVGEFGKTEITDSVSAFSTTPANYVMTRSVDWEAGIRARVGYTPNDTTLFYGAFGPGYAKIDSTFASSQSTNRFTTRGQERQFGYQGGGGVEQKLGNNFSIGVEYLYHSYLDEDARVRVDSASNAVTPFTNPNNGGTLTGTDFRRSDPQFRWHSVRATASFRF